MESNGKPLGTAQRKALCEVLYHALLEVRLLGWAEKAAQAADLADAFHNLPSGMWEPDFSLRNFQDNYLGVYLKKYPDGHHFDFAAKVEQIMAMLPE